MTNRIYFITGTIILSLLLTSTLSADIIARYADHLSLLAFLPSAGIGCYCVLDYLHKHYVNARHSCAPQEEIHGALRRLAVKDVHFKAVFNGNTAILIPQRIPLNQTAPLNEQHSVYVLKLTMDDKRKIIHYDDRFIRTSGTVTLSALEHCFDEPVRCIYSKFNLKNAQEESISLSSHVVRQQLSAEIHQHGWSLK